MKKKMKWLAALAMSAALVLGFAACSHASDSDDPPAVPAYAVNIAASENGTVTADKTSAKEGDKVTLTATPS